MRLVLAGLLFLLLAPPAAAHFHEGLAVGRHALGFRLEAGTVLVEEEFEVQNVGNATFTERIYAWLPDRTTLTLFRLEGFPPLENGTTLKVETSAGGPGLVGYDLGANNASLVPGEGRNVSLRWEVPLPPGATFARRLLYPTDSLRAHAALPLQVLRVPAEGLAGMGEEVVVQRPEEPGLEGWHVFVALVVVLVAGAWWWDRRARRRG